MVERNDLSKIFPSSQIMTLKFICSWKREQVEKTAQDVQNVTNKSKHLTSASKAYRSRKKEQTGQTRV